MAKFQIGKTYATRSVCDHNCIISVTVVSRTAKTINDGKKTFRIFERDGIECVRPWGSYSMAPVVSADKVA